ncbi:MAG: hypothetical protein ABEJ24_02175 [Candidatus Magasanikbacteria bacterium]
MNKIYAQKKKNIKDSEKNLISQEQFEIKEEGFSDGRNNKFYLLDTL